MSTRAVPRVSFWSGCSLLRRDQWFDGSYMRAWEMSTTQRLLVSHRRLRWRDRAERSNNEGVFVLEILPSGLLHCLPTRGPLRIIGFHAQPRNLPTLQSHNCHHSRKYRNWRSPPLVELKSTQRVFVEALPFLLCSTTAVMTDKYLPICSIRKGQIFFYKPCSLSSITKHVSLKHLEQQSFHSITARSRAQALSHELK